MGRSPGEAVAAGHEPPVAGQDPGRLRAHDYDHGHGYYRPHREAAHFQPSRAPQLSQSLREKVPMPVLRATALTVRWGTSTLSGVIESVASRSSDEHATRRRPRIRAIRPRPPTGNGLAARSDSWRSSPRSPAV